MRRSLIVAFAVLFVVSIPAASATEVDRSFNQRFEVSSGARLELEHEDGDVVITPWDQDAIEVDVRYRVEVKRVGIGKDPDIDVRFEQRGDVVRVVGEETSSGGVGFFSKSTLEYVYQVSAPAWVTLDLQGEDGDVEISGWQGEISIHSDDGDLRLSDLEVPRLRFRGEDGDVDIVGLAGEMDLETEDGDVVVRDCRGQRIRIDGDDGDIRLEGCEGSFDLATEDGDIDLSGMVARRLEARTSDGRIEIGLDEAVGELDLDVSTDDGSVELDLGEEVSGTFTLSSSDGGIRVDAEASDLDEGRGRASGRLGDGEGKIRVSTGSGRITLRQ